MKILISIFIFCLVQICIVKPALSQSGWQMQNHSFTNQSSAVDVFFIDTSTGWVCGQFGFLFGTTNGGSNWNQINLSNSYNFNTLCFINPNTGWIGLGTYISAQYRGLIIKTTNGGINWKLDTLSEEGNIPGKITFYNALTGWAAAKGIYRTTNSGLNWVRYYVQGYENFNIRSIAFPDLNTGYCTGTIFNNSTGIQTDIISKSTNGGINWQNIREETSSSGGSLKFYNDLQFLNINTGYLCGNPPLKTTNGGINWFSIMENTSYSSMHFINSNNGWFGKWDYSAFTSDGGLTWVNQPLPISAVFNGIYFVNGVTGFGVGINSGVTYPKVFKTTSGGFTGTYSISGIVRFQDNNQPVSTGYIKALKHSSLGGNLIVIDSVRIQPNGSYSFPQIPQDTIDLMAFDDDETMHSPLFVPTYYPSTIEWQQAVPLYPTTNLTNINIGVYRISNDLQSSGIISGGVYLNTDKPLYPLKDAIIYAKIGNVFKGYSVSTGTGSYAIDYLPQGSYNIVCSRMGYTAAAINQQLGAGNLNNINFYFGVPIGISETGSPVKYSLSQNYPNPFNPVTKISFEIQKTADVKLKIFDAIGREVTVLINGKLNAGSYSVDWDAINYPSGLYIYQLSSENFTETKKMILIK